MNEFKIGEKIEHVLSGDWLLVLEVSEGEPKYKCRAKDMRTEWFHTFELRPVTPNRKT